MEVLDPLVHRAKRLRHRLGDPRPAGGGGLGGAPEVPEVVLVQDHAVVLEAQSPGQLRELGVGPRGLAAATHLGQLGVERVDLLDVPGIELQVLGDLVVRDPVEALELIEPLFLVSFYLHWRHGFTPCGGKGRRNGKHSFRKSCYHLREQTLCRGGTSMLTRWLALALTLVMVAGTSPVLAQAQAPVKIGVIQPLSGSVAASGNYIRMGAEIARDWINAKGGVNGRKVELLIEDNKSDPKEAASAAEKLIVRDKVPAIMGAWGSSMTLAAMPKLEEYGVPMVVETSSAASITRRGNPWIFRISPPSEMEALGLEKYVDKLGVKRVDFLAVNTDWGRGSITAFGDMLRKKGAAVGVAEFMDQAATDMNAQITKIKATGGDTLFLTTAVEQITLVMKQAQEQRLGRKIVTTGGSLAKAFVDEWAKRGHPFEGLTEGFRGHDGIATIVEAIKGAGKDEPKAVRDALWKVSLMGVNGPIKFEKDGPAGKESGQSKPSIFVVQIRDGKVTLPDFLAKK